ncbi:MAG TPA: hypothetical protein VGQ95_09040 [Chthoniobacterales bacterium]|nr:hypothetical protein [Chthoniobacterales bacterium]
MNSPDQIVPRAAILKALAQYLEDFDMALDLFRELEKRMMYGAHFHPSMNAEELEKSLEELLENFPRLVNFERFKDVPEESWGEVAWAEISWNLG